ncbi:L,D-transpeptidase family protein [Sphingomonas melonis]|uniref:Lipoprotein-anchoring transpeptidase ErfK/SrfK n=1 Tax=Sphingomonas melonis TaxID=152682 RepID=A0A7Y9FP14_9SPHN|nr:L,D-transpeptidase family protein [Sphingomonas melonis]NYD90810.1 lipoprotein-anchoring transpeptidase ErfK/SrfK [Sphingomonas melonis]
MAARRALAAKLILAGVAIAAAAAATVPALRPAATPPPRAAPTPPHAAPAAPTPRPAPQPTPDPLMVKRVLDIGPIAFGDYSWDDAGVPAGPLIITVDLAAQTLSVFRDGYEIGATAILYGADDKPTPLGSFPILMKDAHHVSSLYGAPMPYTMRLTDDGVAVHGTEVAWGYATHGCIGVPTAFAKLLFREAKVGDRVIITRGKTLATGQTLAS